MFSKAAYEEFFRYVDFAPWLNTGETLTGVTDETLTGVTGTAALEKTGKAETAMISNVAIFQDKKVIYKIKGGDPGSIYAITIQVVTSVGQKFQTTLRYRVTW